MINALQIHGFKGWKDSGELAIGKITGFFGTNSSGKTSLLQLLLMLKQTSESADRSQVLHLGDDRTIVGLGTLKDVIHGHDEDSRLGWLLRWALPAETKLALSSQRTRDVSGKPVSFQASIAANGSNGSGWVRSMAYSVDDQEFSYEARGKTQKAGYTLKRNGSEDYFLKSRGRPRQGFPPPNRCYGFPDEIRVAYKNADFLTDLELEFERLMGRITYLGPLRAHPERQYTWAGDQPEDMGATGGRWVNAILASRSEGRKKHWGLRTMEGHVAWWLKKLNLIHSFRVEEISKGSNLYRVMVKTAPRASEVAITDVGFGVSQILPVIVLCFYAPRGSTILLEQPEIHLHPSVQAGLADVLIDAVKKRGVQIVVESHSEHLLRRIQRRVADQTIDRDDAALYFCSLENGAAVAERLQVNLFGYIENWPEGFFGDEMGEIEAMSRAAKDRQRAR